MKIIKLTSQNVKKLSAVEITPSGELVIIGGKNGAGKSSVLDSIMYAMAGENALPPKPVRSGQKKAKVRLDLGDLIVTRTFTAAGGTTLTVTAQDGRKYPSPQAVLNALAGKLSFDPLKFSQESVSEQAKTLADMVGVNFKAFDEEYAALYAERTAVNRDLKSALATLQANGPAPEAGLPDKPVEVREFMEELDKVAVHNQNNQRVRADRERLKTIFDNTFALIAYKKAELERLQAEINNLQEEADTVEQQLRTVDAKVEDLVDIDTADIRKKWAAAEETNRKIHHASKFRGIQETVRLMEAKAEKLTDKLEANRAKRADAIHNAKFPIEGLSIGDDGVTLKGIPFSQASSAEQLKVSVAIGLALNPKLKVLLIRDGSLLDNDSLAMVGEMAAKAGAQVWMERVEEGGSVSVVIEDGHIKGQEPGADDADPAPDETKPAPAATKPAASATPPPEDEEDYEVPIP